MCASLLCKFDANYAREKYGELGTPKIHGITVSKCLRRAIGNKGFCILHDEEAWNKVPADRIIGSVNQAIRRGEQAFIGCHLPSIRINLRGTSFALAFCTLHGRTEFRGSYDSLVLFGSVFLDDVDFLSDIRSIDCTNATFHARFGFQSSIRGPSLFFGTKFEAGALMDRCIFEGDALFSGAIFGREMWGSDFSETIFKRTASFSQCSFLSPTDFHNAKFEGDVSFERSRILSPLSFNGSRFAKSGDFRGIDFSLNLETPLVVLEDVVFGNPEQVVFAGSNLSYVSFIGTSIKKLALDNVEWLRIGRREVIASELQLRDALALRTNMAYSPDDVARAYRELRENFEEQRRHSEAGKFFVGEMEAERLRPLFSDLWRESTARDLRDRLILLRNTIPSGKINAIKQKVEIYCCLVAFRLLAFIRVRLSLLSLYGVLSKYGESFWLPALWSLLLIAVSAGAILFQKPLSVDTVFDAIFASASIFLFAEPPRDLPGLLERIFGILLMGMLLIALRRRFLRYQ